MKNKKILFFIKLSSWARINVISDGNNEVEKAEDINPKERKNLNGEGEKKRKKMIRSCWHDALSIK